jgi:Leucine-rich repeat (LRR) protein
LTINGGVLNLQSKNITNVNYITVEGLTSLYLNDNQIVNFNPTYPLPASVQYLYLQNNLMTNTGYSNSQTWANNQMPFNNPCEINFNGNIDSVSGTNLESILLTKNTTVLA